MLQKTYGVPGKLECVLIIHTGKTEAHIKFKGGSIMDFHKVPAKYTTSDPLTQAIIENSPQFARGYITLLRVVEVPDDEAAIARKRDAERIAQKKAAAEQTPAPAAEKAPAETAAPAAEETTTEPAPAAAVDENGVRTIEVSDKSEAIDWLKENYPDNGYTTTKLATKAKFEAACEECNVKFVFTA